jgi:hypothetical protein
MEAVVVESWLNRTAGCPEGSKESKGANQQWEAKAARRRGQKRSRLLKFMLGQNFHTIGGSGTERYETDDFFIFCFGVGYQWHRKLFPVCRSFKGSARDWLPIACFLSDHLMAVGLEAD